MTRTIKTRKVNKVFLFSRGEYIAEKEIPAGTEVTYTKIVNEAGNKIETIRTKDGYSLTHVTYAQSDKPDHGGQWVMLEDLP